MKMINAKGSHHIGLKVKDLEDSVRFYRDLLGFIETGRESIPEADLDIVFMSCGNICLELLDFKSTNEELDEGFFSHIALKVDNIYTALEELKDKMGLDIKPQEIFNGHVVAFFQGPSGETIELFQE